MRIEEYSGPSGAMSDSPWLASEDIDVGQDVEVQIETVLRVEDAVFDAGRKEDIFALQFVGKKKLMVLNATNRKAIVKMFGSITADWRGKKISLYIRDGIRMGKEVKRGIRVRYTGPTESEKLSESL